MRQESSEVFSSETVQFLSVGLSLKEDEHRYESEDGYGVVLHSWVSGRTAFTGMLEFPA